MATMRRRTLFAFSALLGFAAAACTPAKAPRRPERGEATLSVLSYNLNYGMAGDIETLEVIRNADADVVLLQETSPEWEAALREELTGRYPHMSFRHCCRAGGLAVLSKSEF